MSYLSLNGLPNGRFTSLQISDNQGKQIFVEKVDFLGHTLWQISVRSAPLNPLVTRAK